MMGLAAFGAPNLLILDEPTNHLDIDSREALVHALNDYTGAVILISHDRHLIEACADRLWLVADGTVKPFDGDIDDYRRHGARPCARAATTRPRRCNGRSRRSRRRTSRREAAARREALAPLARRSARSSARSRSSAARSRARQGARRAGPLRERSREGGRARQGARRARARFRPRRIGMAGPVGGARSARGGGTGGLTATTPACSRSRIRFPGRCGNGASSRRSPTA